MNLRTVYYLIFMSTVQSYDVIRNRDVYHSPLPSRDSRSRYQCCGRVYHREPTGFHQQNGNRRFGANEPFNKYRNDYQNYPRNYHRYQKDYYYTHPYEHKSQPSKNYQKNYYTRRYNYPQSDTKYIQKRIGFSFHDAYDNVKNVKNGHRISFPDTDIQDQKYHKNNGRITFKNHNDDEYYQKPYDGYRQKYRPGLLGVSVKDSGPIIATDPQGYKHVIHNLPPWTESNDTPDKHQDPLPYKLDPRGGVEYSQPHRFSTEFQNKPETYSQNQQQKEMPLYIGISGTIPDRDNDSHFVVAYKGSLKSHNSNKFQEARPSISSEDEESYNFRPTEADKFRPSPQFFKYSEPDPLYHPNGSPLQTYPPSDVSQPSTSPKIPNNSETEKSTQNPKSETQPKYPDSINAQLPPPSDGTDTSVPYVAATAVTEHIPSQHHSTVTQALEATHKEIQVLQTEPTVQSNPANGGSQAVNEERAEETTHSSSTTQTYNTHFLPTLITYQSPNQPISLVNESNFETNNETKESVTHYSQIFTTAVEQNVEHTKSVPNSTDVDAGQENKVYTDAAIIITDHNLSSTNISETFQLRDKDNDITTEPNILNTQTFPSVQENEDDNTNYQTTNLNTNSNNDYTLKAETTTVEVTEIDKMDTIPSATKLSTENIVTKSVPFLFNQINSLVSHVRSLDYLHLDSNTTSETTDENYS